MTPKRGLSASLSTWLWSVSVDKITGFEHNLDKCDEISCRVPIVVSEGCPTPVVSHTLP